MKFAPGGARQGALRDRFAESIPRPLRLSAQNLGTEAIASASTPRRNAVHWYTGSQGEGTAGKLMLTARRWYACSVSAFYSKIVR